MKKHQTIIQELKELDIHLPMSAMPEMQIPENYFEDFSTQVLSQIKSESFIQSLPSHTPYQLPENYFIQFEEELNNQLDTLDFEELSNETPYSVSENYFNDFPSSILATIKIIEPTYSSKKNSKKWLLNLSIAATVMLFMGLAFLLLQKQQTSEHAIASLEEQLSLIPDYDIEYYAQTHAGELDQSLNVMPIDESMIDIDGLHSEILENSLNQLSDEDLAAYNL
ncbi:MAG: hypothetical protein IPI46_06705 [Bacteroidetes bacterium]|nr:hypothetical protein [Bacteroidota bacterium]